MKRLALAAAVVLFAACSGSQDDAALTDSAAAPAMAPAPATIAPADSAVVTDSIADTTVTDSAAAPAPAGQ